ncbi:MAG: hypothetical protein M1528_02285 [Candidatus Marsarchaeota archaeon]|jgi:small subunit ribosomal protein S3Ae|nr:hypothetical protein [Candidatus Marsarchaeota archaeon]MCL5115337.1 hypothetical protein [Candidatus Marsarchaeota archaeon]
MALQKGIDKWKTKRWFIVYAPKAFDEQKICEIPAADEKSVMGRKIKVSLDHLTHNVQHSATNVTVKITDVNGDAAHTELVMMEEVYSYIRSLVRRYRSISSAVVPAIAKDRVPVVLKAIAITRSRVTASRLKEIRKRMEDTLKGFTAENDANSIIKSVIDGKLQADIYSKASSVTPMSKVEIKKLEVG